MSTPNIPAGFALVPIIPTVAMLDAIRQPGNATASMKWASALACSPPAPPVDAVPGEPVADIDEAAWTEQRNHHAKALAEAREKVMAEARFVAPNRGLGDLGKAVAEYGRASKAHGAWAARWEGLATPMASRAVVAEPVAEMVVARLFHEYENSAKEDTVGFLHSSCLMHAASLALPEGRYQLYTAPIAPAATAELVKRLQPGEVAKETLPLNSLIDWLEFRAAKSTHPDPACGIWAIAVRSAMRELSDRAGVASLVAGEDTKRLDESMKGDL